MSTTWFVGADWLAEHIDDPEIQFWMPHGVAWTGRS